MFQNKLIQGVTDLFEFFKFKRDIRKEIYVRDSKFNLLNLKRNTLGNVVYVQLNFSEKDLMDADFNPNIMLNRKIKPIMDYLGKELNWGEYLTMDVANFVGAADGEESLSYGVSFEFIGYSLTVRKFIVSNLVILGMIAAAIVACLKLCP